MMWQKNLLWIDSTAGLVVGVFVLSLFPFLGPLYGMSTEMVVGMGVANFAYGCYSFTLARSPVRSRARIIALVVANGMWSILCIVTALLMHSQLSILGIGQLLLEAAFVGTLAVLEWKHRAQLLSRSAYPA